MPFAGNGGHQRWGQKLKKGSLIVHVDMYAMVGGRLGFCMTDETRQLRKVSACPAVRQWHAPLCNRRHLLVIKTQNLFLFQLQYGEDTGNNTRNIVDPEVCGR